MADQGEFPGHSKSFTSPLKCACTRKGKWENAILSNAKIAFLDMQKGFIICRKTLLRDKIQFYPDVSSNNDADDIRCVGERAAPSGMSFKIPYGETPRWQVAVNGPNFDALLASSNTLAEIQLYRWYRMNVDKWHCRRFKLIPTIDFTTVIPIWARGTLLLLATGRRRDNVDSGYQLEDRIPATANSTDVLADQNDLEQERYVGIFACTDLNYYENSIYASDSPFIPIFSSETSRDAEETVARLTSVIEDTFLLEYPPRARAVFLTHTDPLTGRATINLVLLFEDIIFTVPVNWPPVEDVDYCSTAFVSHKIPCYPRKMPQQMVPWPQLGIVALHGLRSFSSTFTVPEKQLYPRNRHHDVAARKGELTAPTVQVASTSSFKTSLTEVTLPAEIINLQGFFSRAKSSPDESTTEGILYLECPGRCCSVVWPCYIIEENEVPVSQAVSFVPPVQTVTVAMQLALLAAQEVLRQEISSRRANAMQLANQQATPIADQPFSDPDMRDASTETEHSDTPNLEIFQDFAERVLRRLYSNMKNITVIANNKNDVDDAEYPLLSSAENLTVIDNTVTEAPPMSGIYPRNSNLDRKARKTKTALSLCSVQRHTLLQRCSSQVKTPAEAIAYVLHCVMIELASDEHRGGKGIMELTELCKSNEEIMKYLRRRCLLLLQCFMDICSSCIEEITLRRVSLTLRNMRMTHDSTLRLASLLLSQLLSKPSCDVTAAGTLPEKRFEHVWDLLRKFLQQTINLDSRLSESLEESCFMPFDDPLSRCIGLMNSSGDKNDPVTCSCRVAAAATKRILNYVLEESCLHARNPELACHLPQSMYKSIPRRLLHEHLLRAIELLPGHISELMEGTPRLEGALRLDETPKWDETLVSDHFPFRSALVVLSALLAAALEVAQQKRLKISPKIDAGSLLTTMEFCNNIINLKGGNGETGVGQPLSGEIESGAHVLGLSDSLVRHVINMVGFCTAILIDDIEVVLEESSEKYSGASSLTEFKEAKNKFVSAIKNNAAMLLFKLLDTRSAETLKAMIAAGNVNPAHSAHSVHSDESLISAERMPNTRKVPSRLILAWLTEAHRPSRICLETRALILQKNSDVKGFLKSRSSCWRERSASSRLRKVPSDFMAQTYDPFVVALKRGHIHVDALVAIIYRTVNPSATRRIALWPFEFLEASTTNVTTTRNQPADRRFESREELPTFRPGANSNFVVPLATHEGTGVGRPLAALAYDRSGNTEAHHYVPFDATDDILSAQRRSSSILEFQLRSDDGHQSRRIVSPDNDVSTDPRESGGDLYEDAFERTPELWAADSNRDGWSRPVVDDGQGAYNGPYSGNSWATPPPLTNEADGSSRGPSHLQDQQHLMNLLWGSSNNASYASNLRAAEEDLNNNDGWMMSDRLVDHHNLLQPGNADSALNGSMLDELREEGILTQRISQGGLARAAAAAQEHLRNLFARAQHSLRERQAEQQRASETAAALSDRPSLSSRLERRSNSSQIPTSQVRSLRIRARYPSNPGQRLTGLPDRETPITVLPEVEQHLNNSLDEGGFSRGDANIDFPLPPVKEPETLETLLRNFLWFHVRGVCAWLPRTIIRATYALIPPIGSPADLGDADRHLEWAALQRQVLQAILYDSASRQFELMKLPSFLMRSRASDSSKPKFRSFKEGPYNFNNCENVSKSGTSSSSVIASDESLSDSTFDKDTGAETQPSSPSWLRAIPDDEMQQLPERKHNSSTHSAASALSNIPIPSPKSCPFFDLGLATGSSDMDNGKLTSSSSEDGMQKASLAGFCLEKLSRRTESRRRRGIDKRLARKHFIHSVPLKRADLMNDVSDSESGKGAERQRQNNSTDGGPGITLTSYGRDAPANSQRDLRMFLSKRGVSEQRFFESLDQMNCLPIIAGRSRKTKVVFEPFIGGTDRLRDIGFGAGLDYGLMLAQNRFNFDGGPDSLLCENCVLRWVIATFDITVSLRWKSLNYGEISTLDGVKKNCTSINDVMSKVVNFHTTNGLQLHPASKPFHDLTATEKIEVIIGILGGLLLSLGLKKVFASFSHITLQKLLNEIFRLMRDLLKPEEKKDSLFEQFKANMPDLGDSAALLRRQQCHHKLRVAELRKRARAARNYNAAGLRNSKRRQPENPPAQAISTTSERFPLACFLLGCGLTFARGQGSKNQRFFVESLCRVCLPAALCRVLSTQIVADCEALPQKTKLVTELPMWRQADQVYDCDLVQTMVSSAEKPVTTFLRINWQLSGPIFASELAMSHSGKSGCQKEQRTKIKDSIEVFSESILPTLRLSEEVQGIAALCLGLIHYGSGHHEYAELLQQQWSFVKRTYLSQLAKPGNPKWISRLQTEARSEGTVTESSTDTVSTKSNSALEADSETRPVEAARFHPCLDVLTSGTLLGLGFLGAAVPINALNVNAMREGASMAHTKQRLRDLIQRVVADDLDVPLGLIESKEGEKGPGEIHMPSAVPSRNLAEVVSPAMPYQLVNKGGGIACPTLSAEDLSLKYQLLPKEREVHKTANTTAEKAASTTAETTATAISGPLLPIIPVLIRALVATQRESLMLNNVTKAAISNVDQGWCVVAAGAPQLWRQLYNYGEPTARCIAYESEKICAKLHLYVASVMVGSLNFQESAIAMPVTDTGRGKKPDLYQASFAELVHNLCCAPEENFRSVEDLRAVTATVSDLEVDEIFESPYEPHAREPSDAVRSPSLKRPRLTTSQSLTVHSALTNLNISPEGYKAPLITPVAATALCCMDPNSANLSKPDCIPQDRSDAPKSCFSKNILLQQEIPAAQTFSLMLVHAYKILTAKKSQNVDLNAFVQQLLPPPVEFMSLEKRGNTNGGNSSAQLSTESIDCLKKSQCNKRPRDSVLPSMEPVSSQQCSLLNLQEKPLCSVAGNDPPRRSWPPFVTVRLGQASTEGSLLCNVPLERYVAVHMLSLAASSFALASFIRRTNDPVNRKRYAGWIYRRWRSLLRCFNTPPRTFRVKNFSYSNLKRQEKVIVALIQHVRDYRNVCFGIWFCLATTLMSMALVCGPETHPSAHTVQMEGLLFERMIRRCLSWKYATVVAKPGLQCTQQQPSNSLSETVEAKNSNSSLQCWFIKPPPGEFGWQVLRYTHMALAIASVRAIKDGDIIPWFLVALQPFQWISNELEPQIGQQPSNGTTNTPHEPSPLLRCLVLESLLT